MWDVYQVLQLVAAAQLVLLATIVMRDHRTDRTAHASLFLIATVVAHLLVPPLRAMGAPIAALDAALLLESATPAAFWLLAKVHFDDDFALQPRHAAALIGLGAAASVPAMVPALRYPLWPLAPRLIALAIVAHALFAVHAGGQIDLILSRLRARNTALVLSGTFIFVELLAEVLLGRWVSPATGVALHAVSSFVLVFVVCWISLQLESEFLRAPKPAPEPPAVDPALAERLLHLIEVEQVFRQEGLTIAAIAARLNVHEHKVRHLINAHLGFRNFNAFLHHYRLREARLVLSDPARMHLGVAQIAYDVGYRSLGPFNKAFKELVGQTPTEFRAATTGGAAASSS